MEIFEMFTPEIILFSAFSLGLFFGSLLDCLLDLLHALARYFWNKVKEK